MPGTAQGGANMRTAIKTRNINPFDVQEMRRTMTNKQIAQYYGVTLQTFYWWCYQNNVTTARVTDWEITEALETKTVKEIANEYNVTVWLIYSRLRAMGISSKSYR